MGVDIHSIGQTAHHQSIGAQGMQVSHEGGTQVLAILCDVACAHHRYHMRCIEVCLPFVIEYDGSIGAFLQSLWISLIVDAYTLYAVSHVPLQFLLGLFQMDVHVGQCFQGGLSCSREYVS